MDKKDDNKLDEEDGAEFVFKYNFINTPWDDRSSKSKIGIVSLLVAIAAATAMCVINSFIMQYRGNRPGRFSPPENSCLLVKNYDYPYVARIHSVSTRELLCVGAVISSFAVLANEVCVRSGPILLFLGNSAHPQCKKGVSVDDSQTFDVVHEGVDGHKLIMIRTVENIADCSLPITIGLNINWRCPVYIIGRPSHQAERSLTKQPVTLSGKGNCTMVGQSSNRLDRSKVICVKDIGRCLVRAGDLLVQSKNLLGIASTSAYRSDIYKIAYFADLSLKHEEINSTLYR